MPNPHYQRFAISIPAQLATQIEAVCKVDGRKRSEFFREAVRFYMNAGHAPQLHQLVMPGHEDAGHGLSSFSGLFSVVWMGAIASDVPAAIDCGRDLASSKRYQLQLQ